jgi:hypothetical protein
MTFDSKNILIGIIIGVLITIIIGGLLNDVHIEIQVGNKAKNNSILHEEI